MLCTYVCLRRRRRDGVICTVRANSERLSDMENWLQVFCLTAIYHRCIRGRRHHNNQITLLTWWSTLSPCLWYYALQYTISYYSSWLVCSIPHHNYIDNIIYYSHKIISFLVLDIHHSNYAIFSTQLRLITGTELSIDNHKIRYTYKSHTIASVRLVSLRINVLILFKSIQSITTSII